MISAAAAAAELEQEVHRLRADRGHQVLEEARLLDVLVVLARAQDLAAVVGRHLEAGQRPLAPAP